MDVTPAPLPAMLSRPRRFSLWLVLVGAVLLPCLYLPTLATRFDFIDDGSAVYPSGPMPWGQRLRHLADRIEDNYRHLGPFRPTLHAYWEAEAELLQANAFRWRLTRLVWSMLATAALLGLLRELGLRPGAALLATALALWNPYRNEIWTSLTLAEGVAMPFALLSLVCAARAPGSRRPWLWDGAAMLNVLVALGCKNTFAALVPVQMLLRILPAGEDWREGLRRHGKRAFLLSLPLLMPVLHYVYFRLHWHPGQYKVPGASLAGLGRYLHSLTGAVSLDLMGLGLLVALACRFLPDGRNEEQREEAHGDRRRALAAGVLLLACGVAVYLPMGVVSGRYTMPAVWGLDILLAVLFHELAFLPSPARRRAAYAVLGCGLAGVMVANVGKQVKFAARATFLWETLEYVERMAPVGACLGWQSGPALNVEEGIHFSWHLQHRGRSDIHLQLLAEDGAAVQRPELLAVRKPPDLFISAGSVPPAGPWQQVHDWSMPVWGRGIRYHCALWMRSRSEPKSRETAQGPASGSKRARH